MGGPREQRLNADQIATRSILASVDGGGLSTLRRQLPSATNAMRLPSALTASRVIPLIPPAEKSATGRHESLDDPDHQSNVLPWPQSTPPRGSHA